MGDGHLQCERDSPGKATAASSGFRRNGSWRRLDVGLIRDILSGVRAMRVFFGARSFWGEERERESRGGKETGRDEHEARADKSIRWSDSDPSQHTYKIVLDTAWSVCVWSCSASAEHCKVFCNLRRKG
ncbi:hypothetical protein BC827DRAFT_1152316 [Russula dissimulans]|nr:hypothetical protein BC827DRAFT_1152316 [Russula dissimulans]